MGPVIPVSIVTVECSQSESVLFERSPLADRRRPDLVRNLGMLSLHLYTATKSAENTGSGTSSGDLGLNRG